MTADDFAGIAGDAIAAFCAAHPAEATLLGNHDHDDRLGSPARAATDHRQAELGRLLDRLDRLAGLDTAASVDREILSTETRRELLSLTELDEPSWDAL